MSTKMPPKKIVLRKPSAKLLIDLLGHYLVALWILVMGAFLLGLSRELTTILVLQCAAIAVIILPFRLLALHLLRSLKQEKYIKKIVRESRSKESI